MLSKWFGGKKNEEEELPESEPESTEAETEEAERPLFSSFGDGGAFGGGGGFGGSFGMGGFVDRMKQAVSRTRESFSSRIEGVLAITRTVDESDLEELETALLTSDLGLPTTTAILEQLRERAKRQDIQGGAELKALLKAQLKAILDRPVRAVPEPAAPPKVIFLVGVNG